MTTSLAGFKQVGIVGTLATEKGYPADARAVEASQVLLVQKAGILALLRRQPELALRMLGSMSAHSRASEK